MWLRVARVVFAVSCVLALAQQSNLGSLCLGDDCPQSCPDDIGPHRCDLGCAGCACVGNGTPLSLAPPVPPAPRIEGAIFESEPPSRLPDPRPDTMFHVPRPTLV